MGLDVFDIDRVSYILLIGNYGVGRIFGLRSDLAIILIQQIKFNCIIYHILKAFKFLTAIN